MADDQRYNCNEYQELVARDFKPYSVGHRIMYEAPVRLLHGGQYKINEYGFGIGYGLDLMDSAGIISEYLGYEPNIDSFAYVYGQVLPDLGQKSFTTIIHGEAPLEKTDPCDYVFCIEVIEHVYPEKRQPMLDKFAREAGKGLFLSTPDSSRDDHGVYTRQEMIDALKLAGFTNVVCFDEQWTNLYVGQK